MSRRRIEESGSSSIFSGVERNRYLDGVNRDVSAPAGRGMDE